MRYAVLKLLDRCLTKLIQANGKAHSRWVKRQLKHRKLEEL